MAGLVPDQVFARRTKGNYSGEDYRGVRLSVAELTARVTGSRLADLGVIEPAAVIASLDRVRAGAPIPVPALNRLLGADLWLEGRVGALARTEEAGLCAR
jgi:asparagine synthase (glutamine-hydrolysing)